MRNHLRPQQVSFNLPSRQHRSVVWADIPAQLISGALKEVGQAADKPSGLFMKYSFAVAPKVKCREAHSYQGRKKQGLGGGSLLLML